MGERRGSSGHLARGYTWRAPVGVVLVCALLLVSGMSPAVARPKKKKKQKAGIAHAVAAFEGTLAVEEVTARHAAVQLVDGGKERPGKVLECRVEAGEEWADVTLAHVPTDVSAMRTLRFWIKGEGAADQEIVLRIIGKGESALAHTITAPAAKWTQVELRLGMLAASADFRPTEVTEIAFIWFSPRKTRSLWIDDVEIVEGEGGWRLSEKEQAAHIFGEKRVKKVKKKKTKHFMIWMDTKAAAKKFPKELEKVYERIRSLLGMEEMTGRLPVYIFQNPGGYWKFCERHLGWDLTAAQASAGHGSARYFATYFQGNSTPTVTHELTHAMMHRVVGWGGGSWFQEGAAVYMEEKDSKRSAARQFSPIVRNGKFVPLREFIALERLIDSEDSSGGARTADSLYAQAGAVFEFLLRCPTVGGAEKPALGERLKQLAQLEEEGTERVAAVEKVYAMSIEDLEHAWVAWGAKPPK